MDDIVRLAREGDALCLRLANEAAEAAAALILNLAMDGTPKQVFARTEELLNLGMQLPKVTQLANALTSAGVPIATPRGGALFTRATLVNALATAFQQASGR